MKKIKLKVIGVSYSQTQSGAYALILAEENGNRRVPIIIGGFEAQAIVIRLENIAPPRPLTHDLLLLFAREFGIAVLEAFIYRLEEGVFFSELVCNNGEKEITIDSRTSDAIAIALRFGCPVYMAEDVLDKAGIFINPSNDNDDDDTGSAVNSILEPEKLKYDGYSDSELSKMIEEAIKTENYEKAASIRDEMERRKKIKKK